MRALELFRVECGRMLRSRWSHLAIAISAMSLLGGFYSQVGTTMASMYLAEQVKSACFGGTIVFALLTLYELSRVYRSHTDAITDCVVSPVTLAIVRLLALCCVALTASVLAGALYAPFAVWKLGIVFSPGDYLACFGLFVFPAQVFGCLTAAICYHIIRRADVSALLVLAFLIVSGIGLHREQYLWQWSQPVLTAMSDDFSNAMLFRMAAYSRLVWVALLGGIWILSLLCVRRYGKGLFGSLVLGLRAAWKPTLAMCLILCGCLLWKNEPFFDNSPVDWMSIEQKDRMPQGVYLEETWADLNLTDTFWGCLSGTAVYTLRNETLVEQPLYFTLNTGYVVRRVMANGQEITFEDLHDDYIAGRNIRCVIPGTEKVELKVEYNGMPQEWNISQTLCGDRVISGGAIQLSGKSLSPMFEIAMDEGAPITMDLTLPDNLTPVTSGYTPEVIARNRDGSTTWRARDEGEDNMTLLAGDYVKVDLQGGGIPIEFYYSKKHQRQMDSLDAVAIMEAAVAFCTEHYGPRAFTEDRPFKIVQGTELLFGGFARQNISTMSEESFTTENLRDTEKGASGAEVLAHEIIHQWWGLGVMFMDFEEPYWSSEGITTYTTYRLMKELRGADYADRFYKEVWQSAMADNQNNFYLRHPEYRKCLPEAYQTQLDMTLKGVWEYQGYALMYDRAAQLLGGEDKLDAVLARLFLEGGSEMSPYVTQNDFLSASGLTREELDLD